MKARDIEVGQKYVAKVAGKLTTVRVDSIAEVSSWPMSRRQYRYGVTNMRTGRHTTFRSAVKFRAAYDEQGEQRAE